MQWDSPELVGYSGSGRISAAKPTTVVGEDIARRNVEPHEPGLTARYIVKPSPGDFVRLCDDVGGIFW